MEGIGKSSECSAQKSLLTNNNYLLTNNNLVLEDNIKNHAAGKGKLFGVKTFSKGIQMKTKTLEHSPTLNTVLMVEKVLKNMENSAMTVAELKRKLPKQVNHNTLIIILDYLQYSNKIVIGSKGITWIKNDNPKLREALSKARRLKI